MDFLLLFSVLLSLLRSLLANRHQSIIHGNPVKPFSLLTPSKHGLFRAKRSELRKITECVFATSEEGYYYYEAEKTSEEVCGVYFFADPDRLVQVHLQHLDVDCDGGGLVAFFDGWELSGKFFPGVDDHEKPFRQRYTEFCGSERADKSFTTAQNAGMLHYRIPVKGGGFRFYLEFIKNPKPCNILVESKEEFYTLRNYGKANNCTLMAVFPTRIKVLSLEVGVPTSAGETGTVRQCGEKMSDGLQIGGSDSLDSSRPVLFEDICGLDSSPETNPLIIQCEVSVVRLVSSGRHDNSVTLRIGQLEDVDFLESAYAC